MGFLTALVALVATDAHLDTRVEARLETRARTSTFADQAHSSDSAAGDAEVTPSLFGALDNRGGRITLRYAPTFRVREPYSDATRRTEFNNSQNLEASWSREGRPRLYLLESFYQGRVDLATQPTATVTQFGGYSQLALDVNGGVVWPLTKLISLDTSVGYNFGSGLDPVSRSIIPSQRVWRTRARLEAQLTRVDSIIGELEGHYAEFPGLFSTFGTGTTAAAWKHQLLATTAIELGVLGGLLYDSKRSAVSGAPGGEAVLTHRINTGPHVLNFEGGVRVSPFIDRFLASAYDRGEIATTAAYLFRERWAASLRAGVSRSLTPVVMLDDPQPTSIFSIFGEARAGYVAPRYWQVELAGVYSRFVIGQSAPVNNWLVSLSLTLHAEGQF